MFTIIPFGSVSAFPATFHSPKTIMEKEVSHMPAVRQYFDRALNYIHHMTLATKNSNNDIFTVKKILQQEDVGNFI